MDVERAPVLTTNCQSPPRPSLGLEFVVYTVHVGVLSVQAVEFPKTFA